MTGFNKQALLNLMAYPNEISDHELETLNTVLQEYPYFQLGHSLVAKAKHDKQTYDSHDALTHAAVYAPNRSLLRRLFYEDLKIEYSIATPDKEDDTLTTTGFESREEDHSVEENFAEENTADVSLSVPENYDPPYEEDAPLDEEQVIESDEVYNELEENLRKLRESKNKYTEDESEEENKKKIADHTAKLQSTTSPEKKTGHDIAPILMDLIKESDEKDVPLVYGNRQQNEIIDRFINSEDVGWLNHRREESPGDEEANDLSENSVHINDDLITENLAEIYLRQGKKDKAIEIYHKLIWKFPQKKAYFAEIIENLKAE